MGAREESHHNEQWTGANALHVIGQHSGWQMDMTSTLGSPPKIQRLMLELALLTIRQSRSYQALSTSATNTEAGIQLTIPFDSQQIRSACSSLTTRFLSAHRGVVRIGARIPFRWELSAQATALRVEGGTLLMVMALD